MDPLLNFLTHVTQLKHLPRTGWLLAGITNPESIADHTSATALLALMLAEQINVGWEGYELEGPLDVGQIARLALVHDLAESLLTDLPHRSTDLLGKEVKRAAEARAVREIMAGLPNGDSYVALWTEYDAAATPEARLVKDADKLEMVQQALHYEGRGHANLDEFWHGHEWYYSASEALFQVLREQRR